MKPSARRAARTESARARAGRRRVRFGGCAVSAATGRPSGPTSATSPALGKPAPPPARTARSGRPSGAPEGRAEGLRVRRGGLRPKEPPPRPVLPSAAPQLPRSRGSLPESTIRSASHSTVFLPWVLRLRRVQSALPHSPLLILLAALEFVGL